MKQLWSRIKPYLRWVFLGAAFFFIAKTLGDHWQGIASIQLEAQDWAVLAIALVVTLLAHTWSGLVWHWMLRAFRQPATPAWSIQVYLKTNIAKYLPGNVWHFYGRIWAAKSVGISTEVAMLTVLLEPLLMAAAALFITLAISPTDQWILQGVGLVGVLGIVHPAVMNPALKQLGRLKQKVKGSAVDPNHLKIDRYPLIPLLGEMGFLTLRGAGFLLTVLALTTVQWSQIPLLFGAFSLAWLLGLVVPGAPGGIGIFEATAIALLRDDVPTAIVLSSVALYRLISVLAELIGAGIAWLCGRRV